MEKPVLEKKKEEVTYFKLNNQINIPIDGKIPLHKDKEAAKAFFLEHVNPNTVFFHTLKEKIDYLIENKYIEKEFIDKYSFKFIKQLFNKAYKKKFRFKSFMGAHKFYSQYALKTNDGERYLERFEDRMSFVALYLANGDEELALNLIEELMEQRYVPATPTLLSSGRKRRGELVSCFLLSMTDDMNSIGRTVNSALQLSKMGGGVGINLTSLRASGDPIKGIDNAASGVVPVMKLLEDSFSYANQLGQRQGAGAVYLNVFHPDIVSFLSTKKENADEKIRVKTLSLGLVVPDKFYELAKNDEYMYLFSPYDVNQEYGIDYSYLDITKKYNELVDNPNIRKSKIKARELENEISKLQQESGYPYIINIDTVNRANNIDGQVIMSNLCVTGDTKLLTDNGYTTAKKLYEEGKDLKVVIDNRTKEMNSKEEGTEIVPAIPMQLTAKQAKVYKVTTKQGFEIEATEWHKFYVRNQDGSIAKKQLNELKTGEKLLVQSGEGAYGKNHDPELAYLLGVLAGDGTILNLKNNNYQAKFYLYENKMNLSGKIEYLLKNVIERYADRSFKHNADMSPTFKKGADNLLVLCSGVFGYIINKFFGVNKGTKTDIPEFILNGDKETISAYLSGLYQMDASVNANHNTKALTIEWTSINKKAVKDVQMLLLNMGIYSTIYKRNRKSSILPDGKGGSKLYRVKDTYKLSIQDRYSRELFMEYIELKENDEAKFELFKPIMTSNISRKPKHKYTAEIEKIEFSCVEDVYDTTQENYHSLIFNGIVTGNCSEILQIQEPSKLNSDQTYEVMGSDISCNLGSTNIPKLMKSKDFGRSIKSMVRALTFVTDNTSIEEVPTVKNGNEKYHTVGLGAMGLHAFLAKKHIQYGSEEALEFTDTYFKLLNYWSLVESNNIAQERNESFYGFDRSKYASGEYFDQYYEKDTTFKHDKIRILFKDIFIPRVEDWKQLAESVKEFGLYHAYRLAVAPNGSIGYVTETTSSLHPITQRVEERQEKKTGKTYYPAPYLSDKTIPYYQTAYETDMRKVIDTYAAAQKHIDQGMSLTLFMPSVIPDGLYEWKTNNEFTTRDLNILRHYAFNKGIKSLYYVRTYTGSEEVGANECESCSI